jgi:hypothetical protein
MAAKFTDVITTNAGTVLPGAIVQLLDDTGALVTTYTDNSLTQGAATEQAADDNGLVELYVPDGTYTIRQTYNGVSKDLPNVELYDLSKIATTSDGAVANKAQASAIGIGGTSEDMGEYVGDLLTAGQTAKENIQELVSAVLERPTTSALSSPLGAGMVGVDDGASLQQAIAAAATPAALLASTSLLPLGSTVRTASGASYEVVASGGMLQTAGGVHLNVRPSNGTYLFSAFGAVGGQFCDDALDSCWANLPAGATLHVDRSTNGLPYILDRARPPRTLPLNVIGQPGNQFQLADQSTIFHNTAETVNRDLFGFATSGVLVDGINLDLNKPNNWWLNGGVKTYTDSAHRVNGIIANGSDMAASQPFSNIKITRCKVTNPNWISIGVIGPMEPADGSYAYSDAFGIDGFEISYNETRQGGQSIIYIGAGVRNGKVFGNKGVDVYYDWIRCYRQVLNVDIYENSQIINQGTWANQLWMTEGTKSHRLGIRIGQNASAPGTCHDISVYRNTLRLLDTDFVVNDDQAMIMVSTGNRNVRVDDNIIYTGKCKYGIKYEAVGSGSGGSRNIVDCDDLGEYGISYHSSDERTIHEDNDIRKPKVAPVLMSACSNAEFRRTRPLKGASSSLVYSMASSAVSNVIEDTKIIGSGYAWAQVAEYADIIANDFHERAEYPYRIAGAANLVLPINTAFGRLELELSGMYSSSAGNLEIRFLDASSADITAAMNWRSDKRTQAADAATTTRGAAQTSAVLAELSAAGSTGTSGKIAIALNSRVSGEGRFTQRVSAGLVQTDASFALNTAGAAYVVLTASAGTLSGAVKATHMNLGLL